MKKALFVVMLSICVGEAFAQAIDPAPFAFKDDKAVIIDDQILQLLVNKNWYCYKQYTLRGTASDEYSKGVLGFILQKDHSFEASRGTKGKWEVQEKKLLHLVVFSEHEVNQEKIIGGSYVIYNITDDHLVLVKNLTSDLEAKIVFYCKVIEKAAVPVVKKQAASTMTEAERKAWQEKRIMEFEQMNKEGLLKGLQEELFMRGIKSPQNLEELTREDLLKIRIQLIKGEYRG
ncbi:MAG: hypothetical protein ACK4TA_25155 [Saprospiraceae bacterium]